MTKKGKYKFGPSPVVRKLKAADIFGVEAELTLQNYSTDLRELKPGEAEEQYVVARPTKPNKACLWVSASGWVPKLGEKGTVLTAEVLSACFMQNSNGGRSDHTEYPSYKAYFNDDTRQKCIDTYRGGLLFKIGSGPGNSDRVDLVITVRVSGAVFKLDTTCGIADAPEEWYSEYQLEENPWLANLADAQLYDTAEEAHKAQDEVDDLFGSRYFPIIVCPVGVGLQAYNLAQSCKGHSIPVVNGKQIIIGCRCKPDEIQGLIDGTYELGGKIAKRIWDFN